MNRSGVPRPAWLPLIVAAIVVPVAAAAIFGGPGAALVVAVIMLIAIVIRVARRRDQPIEVAADDDRTRHVLLAVSEPVDDPRTAEEIARVAHLDSTIVDTEILALAPTQPSFLDRWASDVGAARAEAQRKLEITISSLRRTDHLEARGEIGESDLVIAVEDALREFPADEVILATGPREEDHAGAEAAEELRERLPIPFEHVVM